MADHGRPTDYKPEFCERIIKLAKQGLFLEEIAEEFEVDYVTMWRWSKNPDCIGFCKAYTRAKNIILGNLKRDMLNKNGEKFFQSKVNEFLITQMTNQMQHSPVAIKGISSEKCKDRVQAVLDAAESEQLRPDQFNNLLNGLKTALEIEHGIDALEKLEKIEEKK